MGIRIRFLPLNPCIRVSSHILGCLLFGMFCSGVSDNLLTLYMGLGNYGLMFLPVDWLLVWKAITRDAAVKAS